MSLAMSHQRNAHRPTVHPRRSPLTRTAPAGPSSAPAVPSPATAGTAPAAVGVRTSFVAAAAAAALVLVAVVVLDQALWPYAGALVLVAVAAFALVSRPAPTPAIPVLTQVAVAGERRTVQVLEPLRRAGWSVENGIRRHRFNVDFTIDHLVVGPNGPFALLTKVVTGSVRIDRDLVSLTRPGATRPDFPSDTWAHGARTAAAEANHLLAERAGKAIPVPAVVVIWGEFPQRCVSGHNVTFVHGDDLAGWLLAQPVRLSAARVAEYEAAGRPVYELPTPA